MKTLRRFKLGCYVILIIAFIFILVQMVQAVTAQAPEPGTDGDPLVTQGYVDQKIGALTDTVNDLSSKTSSLTTSNNSLTTKVNDMAKKTTALEADITELSKTATSLSAQVEELTAKLNDLTAKYDALNKKVQSTQTKTAKFERVKLAAGKQLLAGASTELIIRTGQAKAVKGTEGVLIDVTAGVDVTTGAVVASKRLILSTVDDGRGLKAVTDTWVLVKGAYRIK